jgi:hypothetical protein
MSTLNGWHLGERIVHHKLGHDSDFSIMSQYQYIDCDLPADHAKFHSTRLPFVPVITLDSAGRPWGSILAGSDGKPGFIKNSRYSVLSVEANVWPGDPLLETAKTFGNGDSEMLVAGIGIEFPTRRRNKFAGKVTSLQRNGETFSLDLTVNEAIGFVIDLPFLVVDAPFFYLPEIVRNISISKSSSHIRLLRRKSHTNNSTSRQKTDSPARSSPLSTTPTPCSSARHMLPLRRRLLSSLRTLA